MKDNALDSKYNRGDEYLIPKSEWVPANEIQGEEINTLRHPIIETAFQRILEDWEPQHKICLMSLCTTSRPYYTSQKWKKFIECFADKADLVVCSNGGIIPRKYWECYPYLTYDAHSNSKYDDIYIDVCYRRLKEFFSKFDYDKIVFNFRPTLRNRVAAERLVANMPEKASKMFILPTEETYNKAKSEGFPFGKMMPDLDPRVLDELSMCINGTRIDNEKYKVVDLFGG